MLLNHEQQPHQIMLVADKIVIVKPHKSIGMRSEIYDNVIMSHHILCLGLRHHQARVMTPQRQHSMPRPMAICLRMCLQLSACVSCSLCTSAAVYINLPV